MVEEKLRELFRNAVEKSVKPTPLISPRWLKSYPNGRPADFRYIGAPRVAKAAGWPVEKVVREILRNIDLGGLGLEAKVRTNGWIDLNFRQDKRSGKV
ncbi:MAG: hypothetical protein ACP5HU_07650 [Phycisphaerae bacterium]